MRPREELVRPGAPWHALLAPLPDGATPVRRPVAPPEVLASPNGAAIAGWDQILLHLSAGAAGLRTLLVVVDGDDRPISASDHVIYRVAIPEVDRDPGTNAAEEVLQLSIGGRLEYDGAFLGTMWRSVAPADDEPAAPRATAGEPGDEAVAALRSLVTELIRRAGPRA